MNKIHAVIYLGSGLMIVGAIWMIGDPEVDSITDDYALEGRSYQTLMDIAWNVAPTVIFFLGIFCLIAGAAGSRMVTV